MIIRPGTWLQVETEGGITRGICRVKSVDRKAGTIEVDLLPIGTSVGDNLLPIMEPAA